MIQRIAVLGLVFSGLILLTPLGLFMMRLGGARSLAWVFGTWLALVCLGGFISWRRVSSKEIRQNTQASDGTQTKTITRPTEEKA